MAIAAVTRALAIAGGGAGTDGVASKGGRDLVTAADVAVEDAVGEVLGHALGVDSLVGSANRRPHDELLDLARALPG